MRTAGLGKFSIGAARSASSKRLRPLRGGKGDDGAIGLGAAVILEAFQDAAQQVDLGERIRQAAGDFLLHLEAAAKRARL